MISSSVLGLFSSFSQPRNFIESSLPLCFSALEKARKITKIAFESKEIYKLPSRNSSITLSHPAITGKDASMLRF